MTPLEPQASAHMGCDHDGLHTPLGLYSPDQAEIRWVTVCDACGNVTREVHREGYAPNFDPAGNDPYIAA
jgi:hypothetical protein